MSKNKFILKLSLLAGLFFGVCAMLSPPYFGGIGLAILKGIIGGLLFVIFGFIFCHCLFFVVQSPFGVKKLPQLIIPNNEKIIQSIFAILRMEDNRSVRGKLYLLENTLQFQPYTLSLLKNVLIIELKEIKALDTFKVGVLASTGLKIITQNSQLKQFILFDTPIWIKLINEQIAKLK